RTPILLPFLIVFIFGSNRISFRKFAYTTIVLIVAAAILIPIYYNPSRFGAERTVDTTAIETAAQKVIYADLSRAPLLYHAIDNSELTDTKILNYPMQGYVYTMLMYIPRPLAPFKGYSVTWHHTAYIMNWRVDDKRIWGFGLGILPE